MRIELAVVACAALLGLVAHAELRPPEPRAVRLATTVRLSGPVERGRNVYERFGCAQCHGADAKGGFPNANSETAGKVPGLLFVKEGYTPEELRRKILNGVKTIGKADPKGPTPPYRMPGWAGQMSDGEVTDLVAYLLSLYPNSAEEKWR